MLVAVASALAGCSGSGLGPSAAGCRPQCHGVLDGARYLIRVPEHWNGTLLIYSHGYRSPYPAGGRPPSALPQVSALDQTGTGTDAISRQLLSDGYALAGSAYRRQGWAVADGVRAAEQLYRHFVQAAGKPARTYAWGDSLGGLVTELLAEQDLPWLSGAAPMCGPVAGPIRTMDLFLDAAAAVKALLVPGLQLTGFRSLPQAQTAYQQGAAAVAAAATQPGGGGWAKLAFIAALTGLPDRGPDHDGHDVVSRAAAVAASLTLVLDFGTLARYEIEQRSGGNPSGNRDADYRARISAPVAGAILALGGDPAAYLAALEQQPRVAADPAARAKLAASGDPTGALRVPTLTMHTEADPLVLVQNESVLRTLVAAHGRSAKLLQLFIAPPPTYTTAPYGAGHCAFTAQQRVATITTLDRWVRTGVRPDPGELGSAFGAGLDPGYDPAPWPA